MATLAYLRVSTKKDQTCDNQKKIILDAGFAVDQFFADEGVSGSVKAVERPMFIEMLKNAPQGTTIICTMIDRLGRNASDILNTVDEFKRLGISLRVIQLDGIDLCSSMGKLILTVMAACAELEKNLIVERTIAGLERTKSEGTILGPRLTITPDVLKMLVVGKNEGLTLDKLSEKSGVDRMTISRNVKKWGDDVAGYEEEYFKRQRQYDRKAA